MDYLLEQLGMKVGDQEPRSFDAILNMVVKQVEHPSKSENGGSLSTKGRPDSFVLRNPTQLLVGKTGEDRTSVKESQNKLPIAHVDTNTALMASWDEEDARIIECCRGLDKNFVQVQTYSARVTMIICLTLAVTVDLCFLLKFNGVIWRKTRITHLLAVEQSAVAVVDGPVHAVLALELG